MNDNSPQKSGRLDSPLFTSGAATDIGNVRSLNQDQYRITKSIAVVADGMGGHNGGEIAAEIAVTTMLSAENFQSVKELARLVQEANRSIHIRAEENINLAGMGTTLCALSEITDQDLSKRIGAVNVGDSRIYLLANNKLKQISVDHSVVQNLIDNGQITESEAKSHPHRNVITRSIGTNPSVEVDFWEIEPILGDRFLLCSDGLTNELSNTEIAEILINHIDPQEAADQLIQAAIAKDGLDNVTAIVLNVVRGNEQPELRNHSYELQSIPDAENLASTNEGSSRLKMFIKKLSIRKDPNL